MQENPFADLIPNNAQGMGAQPESMENPFADLIPENSKQQLSPTDQQPERSTGQKLKDYAQQAIQVPIDIGDSVMEGLSRFGAGIGQLVYPGIDKIAGTNLTGKLQQERQRNEKAFNKRFEDKPGYQALALASEVAPTFLGGGAVNAARAPAWLMNAVKGAPSAVKGLAQVGGIAGKNAGLAAAYAPIGYDPSFEKTGLQGGLTKAAEAAPLGAALGVAGAGLGSAVPLAKKGLSSLIGDSTQPELAKTIEALRGTKTGLGDVVNSPALKKFQENVLARVPFSGVEHTQLKTAKQLTGEGEQLISSLNPEGFSGSVGDVIQKSLKQIESGLNKEKRQLYSASDKLAEDSGVKVNGSNYGDSAKEILAEIKGRSFGDISSPAKTEIKKLTTNIANSKEGIKSGSVKDANLQLSDLREAKNNAYMNGEKYAAGAYGRLHDALRKDLDTSIELSGNSKLKEEYAKAQKHYAEKIAPFEDSDIVKFARKGADPDTLVSHFIKTGPNDRSHLLGKLVDKLPEDQKRLMAHEYMRNAYKEGTNGLEFQPQKALQLYNKLGPKTREKLFPADFRAQMKKYSLRVGKNTSALTAMQNPQTGARLGDMFSGAAIMNAIYNPARIPGMMLISGAAKGANSALNSEWLRKAYLHGLSPIGEGGRGITGGLSAISYPLQR